MRSLFLLFIALSLALPLAGCAGYALKGSAKNQVFDTLKISRVYVEPIHNLSFKAGVENVVYNALVKELSGRGGVQIVNSAPDADAIIRGTVNSAGYSGAGSTRATGLEPRGLGANPKVVVATVYTASLGCSFQLLKVKRNPLELAPPTDEEDKVTWFDLPPAPPGHIAKYSDPHDPPLPPVVDPDAATRLREPFEPLWGSSFSRGMEFPGNNQLSVLGTTSALINDSEFDRALRDLAESMMPEVHAALIERF